jgi:hypothetical protein
MSTVIATTLLLPVELTPAGITAARRGLAEIEGLLNPGLPLPSSDASARADVVTVYDHARTTRGSRTPDLLELFVRTDAPLNPEEIGRELGTGQPLSKRSARAVVRNLMRMEGGLLQRGHISRRVLVKDFSGYGAEGAGRYSLSVYDRDELRSYLSQDATWAYRRLGIDR